MEFYNVCDQNSNKLRLFLNNVPSIKEIDDEIIDNAIFATEDDKVVGCISYEEYDNKGLIRYFIFKSIPESKVFEDLFNNLEKKMREKGISEIIGVSSDNQTKELFDSLGFLPVSEKYLFIDEELKRTTQFQNAVFMFKKL